MNNDSEEKIVHAAPVPPFVRFVASAVPMVFDNSLSYYEALCALWKWLQDDVIDVINHNASVTEVWRQELTTFENDLTDKFNDLNDAFDQLHEYVETYFDNLDVQEEINNKLDEMVEDGTLQEIITTYIQSNVAWTFDTVADMKQATNLVNGSYARTLGFHSLNDNGGALYKITNSGTANEMNVIAVGSLFAHLVLSDKMNSAQFGIEDGDDITSFLALLTTIAVDKIEFTNGTYYTTDTTTFNKSMDIDFGDSTIISSCVEETFKFEGNAKATTSLASSYSIGDAYFNVNNNNNVNDEDLIVIGNDELFNYSRDYYKKGIVTNVSGIRDYHVYTQDKLPYDLDSTDSVVKTYSPIHVKLSNLKLIGRDTLTISIQNFGILLKHCSESTLHNVYVDNFLYNIYVLESNNVTLDEVDTNKAVVSGITPGTTYNAYGVALNGSNFYIKNSSFNSGQHGITTTNTPECPRTVFNVNVEDCVIKSESNYGFGAHSNTVGVRFKNCSIYGFVAIHNTEFDSCWIQNSGGNYSTLSFTDSVELANYKIKNCKFASTQDGLPILRISNLESNESSLELIDKIEFENCSNAKLSVIKYTGMGDSATVNKISIKNCTNFGFNEQAFTVNDFTYLGNNYDYNDLAIEITGTVGNVYIRDCKMKPRYRIIRFNGTVGIVVIDSVDCTGTGYSTSNTLEFDKAPDYVYISKLLTTYGNMRMYANQYPNLVMSDSIIDNRATLSSFTGKNLVIRNSKIDSQTIRNVFSNANNVHFYEVVADDGTVSYTAIS